MSDQSVNGDVAADRFIGRRLKANSGKPEVLPPEGEGGRYRFTQNAFTDKRGNLSVDAFWHDNRLKPAGMQAYVDQMTAVCETEGQEICGWAFCKVGVLLQHSKMVVERVVHTPTATNANHAELVRPALLQPIVEGPEPDLLLKAQLVAKILVDFHNTYGHYTPKSRPEQQS